MNKRQTVDESAKQIFIGMRLINKIDNITALDASDQNVSD